MKILTYHYLKMFILTAFLMTPTYTQAQSKAFSGVYGIFEMSQQNIIGGSFVNNIDFLAQDNRTITSFHVGARYQFNFGFVIGAEGSVGLLNGDLNLTDPQNQLDIAYENNKQTTLGLISGFAFGAQKNWLFFGYLSEATRNFDVNITQAGNTFTQSDEQGFLRYGVGLEKQLLNHFNLRISAGTGRADFGDQQTNIDVKKKFEFAVGAIFQL